MSEKVWVCVLVMFMGIDSFVVGTANTIRDTESIEDLFILSKYAPEL